MIDLGLTDEPTFKVCFMIDRYSFYFSLSGNSYLLRILFTSVNISFHKKKSTVWLRFGRDICVRDNKKRGNSAKNYPFSWFYFLQSILVLLWNWIDRNVLFLFVFSINSLNLLLHLIHIIFEFLDATIHFVNKAVALFWANVEEAEIVLVSVYLLL